jgi:hypothetical protein
MTGPTKAKRAPIWCRYVNEATDRKRDQIERVLISAGARFAVHRVHDEEETGVRTKVLTAAGPMSLPSVILSDLDWTEDHGIWIEAYVLADKAERRFRPLPP